MKDIYEKPMASIIFTVKTEVLALSSRINKARLTAFTTAIQKHNEVQVRPNIWKEKGIQMQMKKEGKTMCISTDDMISYTEKS